MQFDERSLKESVDLPRDHTILAWHPQFVKDTLVDFDVIIHRGTVVDGSGQRRSFVADLGFREDRIAAVGDLNGARAKSTVDAQGLVVSPGFIDAHVHSEIALLGGRDQMAGALQGITTHFLSPDGFGWAPLSQAQARELWRYTQFAYQKMDHLSLDWPTVESYLSLFPGNSPLNVVPQAPHCAIRLAVMGWDTRVATDEELRGMERITREWMDAGAVGLCLGLDYSPSINADMRELVALARVLASYQGVFAAHMRYQVLGRYGAWQELLEVSREAEVPVHASHERVDEAAQAALDRVEQEDIDLTFESYLYPAGMTHIAMLLPVDVQDGGIDAMLLKMADPAVRRRSLVHLKEQLGTVGDQIVCSTGSGRFTGATLAEAADKAGRSWEEFAYDLVIEEEGHELWISPWLVSSEEKERIVRCTAVHPRMFIASDGGYNIAHPHPRSHGCFARVLRRFVRELGLLSLEEAIYKMSGFPAHRFGLKDRGCIAEGKAADVVVFDPVRIADRSTWQNPVQTAVGVEWVFVNGIPVVASGQPTGHLPGQVLRRSA
ncbi:MAG: D-aminoacylase [Chloroflexi bacterium]|nr:D-aminoacylase [Chloroflexota bacterium]